MRIIVSVVSFMVAAAAPLAAQSVAKVDPGMSKEQVVAALGQPVSVRSKDSFTYLLYRNGCEKTCGMNDLVVLDSGKVVDAVFRSSARQYTGTSSSPRRINEAEARKKMSTLKSDSSTTAPAKTPPDSIPPSFTLQR